MAQQRQGFDAQVRSLLDMGQQVRGQSEEVSGGFSQLQRSRAELEAAQAALAEQRAAAEKERRAAAAERAEAEAAGEAAGEARLAAAAEQRKLGQERLESLRAAEVARELQLWLAALVRTAVAAGVPGAEAVWQQLAAAVGAPEALGAAPLPAAPALSPTKPLPAVAATAAAPSAFASSYGMGAQHAGAAAPLPAVQPESEGARYRSLLADLERSIDRWRGQLQAGEPLTFGAAGGGPALAPAPCLLGGASFYLPQQPPAQPEARRSRSASPQKQRSNRRAPVQEEWEEEEAHSDSGEEEACDVQPRSRGRHPAHASVAFMEEPRAAGSGAAACSSLPSSPARPRGGIARGAAMPRPASAGSAGSFTAGQVRAVTGGGGITLEAEYSMGGSPPSHGKPRKWLNSRGGEGEGGGGAAAAAGGRHSSGSPVKQSQHSSGELDGCRGRWGTGIFSFRKSADGAPGRPSAAGGQRH